MGRARSGPGDRDEGPPDPSLSIKEVSQRLRVSYNPIRTLILRGQLVAFKFLRTYRISERDLARFLESSRVEARGREARPPALKATTLKHLDGARLRDAWTRQGVHVPPTGGGSARSSESSRGPTAGSES